MNGAERLIETAHAAGVEVCFANPGTTEMPLVAALDADTGIRPILALFEGVCTGAADGYGRMTGKAALTLLHLGPGFANGIANLHNARRARSPIVNVIGDHASWHLALDAPLTSDIESLARPVSAWVRKAESASGIGQDVAEAIAAANRTPGRVATLIVPSDCLWGESSGAAAPLSSESPATTSDDAVRRAAESLRGDGPGVLFLGAQGLREAGLRAAARIATATGCRLVAETFPARMERGSGLPAVERLPYFPEQALDSLAGTASMVLAGAAEPVSFFGYPETPSRLTPEGCSLATLAAPEDDVPDALIALAEALGAGQEAGGAPVRQDAERPSGELTPATIGPVIAALQPEGAILVDEAATSGFPYFAAAVSAPPHSYLALTGGAIGQGMPCATGAAVAAPERPVISFQADGSGMYTVQSLWTQARESLNVTTLLCSNRAYRILRVEMARAGVEEPGALARSLTDLSNPEIDWVRLAEGLGVPGVRVDTVEELWSALERSLAEPGPQLIEITL